MNAHIERIFVIARKIYNNLLKVPRAEKNLMLFNKQIKHPNDQDFIYDIK